MRFLQLPVAKVCFGVVCTLAIPLLIPQARLHAQEHAGHEMPPGMDMPMGGSTDSQQQAKLLMDKRESEFNHHLAGFFVLLAGLIILANGSLQNRLRFASFVWPVCFLLSGLFLLVWSDTELWPFGPQSWYYGLTHHAEVLQHKVFGILLVVIGVIELQRTRGVLKSAWSSWVFPALTIVGSVMLFFHEHQAGMHGPNHMEIMERIQSEHFSFAMAGFGIALSKGLAETQFAWRPFFERLFPALLMVLGALLLVYVE